MNGEHAQRRLHRHKAAQPRITALKLLADQLVADRIEAGTAVAFKTGAQQAQLGNFRYKLVEEDTFLNAFGDKRQGLFVNITGHDVANTALLFVMSYYNIHTVHS